jgi:hypothetical protein
MARGWESKSIEAQQEEASGGRVQKRPLSEAERLTRNKRRILELARTRATQDLDRASSVAHRHMLEEAIRALDDQLRDL